LPVIATNTAANTSLYYLARNSRAQEKSLAKVSSGSRIVTASDDAAGLAVSTALTSDITTLSQSSTNARQGISLLQVADGAFKIAENILNRMISLASYSLSGAVTDNERVFLDTEYTHFESEIDGMRTSTTFNGERIADGSYNHNFQVGVVASDVISVNLINVNLGNFNGIGEDIDAYANAFSAYNALLGDIGIASTGRAIIGSYLSSFEFRGDIIDTSLENLKAARSAIIDVDLAAEQTNLVGNQVMTESSIAALAQANKMKSDLLQLVR